MAKAGRRHQSSIQWQDIEDLRIDAIEQQIDLLLC